MPMQSKAQNRAMHEALENPGAAKRMGIPQDVAEKFVNAQHGHSLKGLPERKAEGGSVGPYPVPFKW